MLGRRFGSLQGHIDFQLVEALSANTKISSPLSVLLVLVYCGALWGHLAFNIFQMTAISFLIVALLGRLYCGFKRMKNWRLKFTILNFFVSLGWAGLFISTLRVSVDDSAVTTLTFALIAGLVASTPHSLSLSRRDFYTFMTLILSTLVYAFLRTEFETAVQAAGIGFIVLLGLFLARQRSQQAESWLKLQTVSYELQKQIDHFPGSIGILKNGKWVRWNKEFAKILNQFDTSSIVQKWHASVIEFSKNQKNTRQQIETILPTDSGAEEIYLLITENVQTLDGQETIVTALNIHEIKRLELENKKHKVQIEQNAKMAALGVMSSGLAHEINNPLATIMGRVQLIQMILAQSMSTLPDDDSEKIFKSIDVIQKTIHRISKIIRGLRSFARETEGDPFDVISLNEVVEATLSFCESRFQNHGVDLQVEIGEDIQLRARGTEVSQVLLNTLNNSFDAVENLKERWVHLIATKETTHILIRIQDSGSGIPLEIRDKIMIPFFTTKEVGKGTGLGLSLSRGIIEAHGGKMYFNHTSPHTELVIELPLANQALNSPRKAAA